MADDERMGESRIIGSAHRLVRIELDEAGAPRRSAETEHERAIAIYDILEENSFALVDSDGAPVDGRRHRDNVREGSAQVRGGDTELVWTRAPARGLGALMSWMGDRPLCVYYQILRP